MMVFGLARHRRCCGAGMSAELVVRRPCGRRGTGREHTGGSDTHLRSRVGVGGDLPAR